MPSSSGITREEILGGMQVRRARTLLYLIENRTAHLAARSKNAMRSYGTEEEESEQYLAFLESFALGKDPPIRPSIQDIERYAPRWAHLIPENPALRASFLHVLGEKYRFNYRSIPAIRVALGADGPEVAAAYRRSYKTGADEQFSTSLPLRERLSYTLSRASAWMEALPPFWAVFFLTLTEVVGAGMLALPIAMARLGPLPSIALLVIMGIVNVVTISSMAETVTRTGSVRYGNSYFGRMVEEYLGKVGASFATAALASIFFLGLISYYLGLASTLSGSTGLRAEVWAALLFIVTVYYVTRGSLDSTIASALVVGAVNILLILVLSAIAFTRMDPNLLGFANLPFIGGQSFDPSDLDLVFGVLLCTYSGHTSVGNCGKLVLQRDPSGRSLIWGVACAQIAAMALFSIWILAVNGAIPVDVLVAEKGTPLAPLALYAGPIVHPIGSVFVILAMGMASIHLSIGLFNLVKERMPKRAQTAVLMSRESSRLVLRSREDGRRACSLGFTYRGMVQGAPQFEVCAQTGGGIEKATAGLEAVSDQARLSRLLPGVVGLSVRFELTLVDVGPDHVRLKLTTPMAISSEEGWGGQGLSILDALDGAEADTQLLSWLIRQGESTLTQIAAHLDMREKRCGELVARLVAQGQLLEKRSEAGSTSYRARLSRRRGGTLSREVWQALGSDEPPTEPRPRRWPRSLRLGVRGVLASLSVRTRGRFIIAAAPLVLAFLLSEWAIATGVGSYTAITSLTGVVSDSIFTGVVPALLILSSRRKGDMVPGYKSRALGSLPLQVGIWIIFVGAILIHGVVIWQDPLMKLAAFASAMMIVAMTIAVLRHGAMRPRAVVELRQQEGEESLKVTAIREGEYSDACVAVAGARDQSAAATGCAVPTSGLLTLGISMPGWKAMELKLWAHRVKIDGDSEPLPASALLVSSRGTEEVDLRLTGGERLMELDANEWDLQVKVESKQSLFPPGGHRKI